MRGVVDLEWLCLRHRLPESLSIFFLTFLLQIQKKTVTLFWLLKKKDMHTFVDFGARKWSSGHFVKGLTGRGIKL